MAKLKTINDVNMSVADCKINHVNLFVKTDGVTHQVKKGILNYGVPHLSIKGNGTIPVDLKTCNFFTN